MQLPTDGPGWRAVRVARNRHWGHPATIGFVRDLAGQAQAASLATLYIGDLSQPRGGPMAYGHASHQTGLDVDVWLNLLPKPLHQPPAARETIETPSLVLPAQGPGTAPRVDPARWQPGHATLLRLAATHPAVDRVLVNPAIKRHLCETVAASNRAWLRKIRPWWGHDAHMHVHLTCPADSATCRNPAPMPAGDGCDATLDWWFEQPPVPPAAPTAPGSGTRRALPPACLGLLRRP